MGCPSSSRLAPHGAPLCPAGHLPRKGGDRPSDRVSQISDAAMHVPARVSANLPPCGGDVRQDREGQRRAPTANPIAKLKKSKIGRRAAFGLALVDEGVELLADGRVHIRLLIAGEALFP